MTSMFERLAGTPCAGCIHMGWDLYYNQPCGICTLKLRNRYGTWKPAAAKCEKLGFEFYEPEEWKVEAAEAWAEAKRNEEERRKKEELKNSVPLCQKNAVRPVWAAN